MKRFSFLIIAMVFIIAACTSSDDTATATDNFNRKAMLENIADNIIIPAYQNFHSDVTALEDATSSFVTTTNEANLVSLRAAWTTAYLSWQSVGMFEIGKAEELSYRNFLNVYPVNVTSVTTNISSGSYDLNSVSQQDEQGFGALDYLINGLADSDEEIVNIYTETVNGGKYQLYLTDLVSRINTLTLAVLNDWETNYRDVFVANSGSSATSSVDKLVNDFIFHYEKYLRAGKIGIPAGVFSGSPLDDKVEAFYKGNLSKQLFEANLTAMQDLFNGKYFDSTANGESLKTYLDFLNSIKSGEDLSTLINDQFDISRSIATNLDSNFSVQVRTNNNLMLNTYDELQKNVVFLKVDMLQAISVSVDYIDADGD